MASTRSDREERRARTAYVVAAEALRDRVREWNALDVPVQPDGPGDLRVWTAEQQAATEAVAHAWRKLVVARREYDALRGQ